MTIREISHVENQLLKWRTFNESDHFLLRYRSTRRQSGMRPAPEREVGNAPAELVAEDHDKQSATEGTCR